MKSLKESLLSNDIDDLGVELPDIKDEILAKTLNDKYHLDYYLFNTWADSISSTINEGPDVKLVRDARRRIQSCLDDMRSKTRGTRGEIQNIKNTKEFWEELDKIIRKFGNLVSFINLNIPDNRIVLLTPNRAAPAQRYKLCQELMKSKWVEAAGCKIDNDDKVSPPTGPNDPELEMVYIGIDLSKQFITQYNK